MLCGDTILLYESENLIDRSSRVLLKRDGWQFFNSSLTKDENGDCVAVFSHHGFLEYLIPTALGVKPHIFRFALNNVSVTVVEFCRDGNVVLRCVNE